MSEHSRDSQTAAFREAAVEDFVTDDQLAEMVRQGALNDVTNRPTVSIESWEQIRWDSARIGPKSVQEAREALAARVDDPSAPDNDATAYDDLASR